MLWMHQTIHTKEQFIERLKQLDAEGKPHTMENIDPEYMAAVHKWEESVVVRTLILFVLGMVWLIGFAAFAVIHILRNG